jgi:hypothetical protein
MLPGLAPSRPRNPRARRFTGPVKAHCLGIVLQAATVLLRPGEAALGAACDTPGPHVACGAQVVEPGPCLLHLLARVHPVQ